MNKYYKNCATGEITENHDTAMDWYRQDDPVEVYKNGKMTIRLESLGLIFGGVNK